MRRHHSCKPCQGIIVAISCHAAANHSLRVCVRKCVRACTRLRMQRVAFHARPRPRSRGRTAAQPPAAQGSLDVACSAICSTQRCNIVRMQCNMQHAGMQECIMRELQCNYVHHVVRCMVQAACRVLHVATSVAGMMHATAFSVPAVRGTVPRCGQYRRM